MTTNERRRSCDIQGFFFPSSSLSRASTPFTCENPHTRWIVNQVVEWDSIPAIPGKSSTTETKAHRYIPKVRMMTAFSWMY